MGFSFKCIRIIAKEKFLAEMLLNSIFALTFYSSNSFMTFSPVIFLYFVVCSYIRESSLIDIWPVAVASSILYFCLFEKRYTLYSYLCNKRACTLNYFGLFFYPACTYCMPARLTIFQFFSTLHTKYILIWIDMSSFTQYMSKSSILY